MRRKKIVGPLTKNASGKLSIYGYTLPRDGEIELFLGGKWVPTQIEYFLSKQNYEYHAAARDLDGLILEGRLARTRLKGDRL